MKVFAIQTYEPKRFLNEDDFFDLGELGLFADREQAEVMATKYNEMFNDETQAQVVELDVTESGMIDQQKEVQQGHKA